MSEDNRYSGKLMRVSMSDETLEQSCERICKANDIAEISPLYDSWAETLRDELYEEFFIINGELWEAKELKEGDPYDNLFYSVKNDDGTISFITQYHNGGTCLSEMISHNLK